MDQLPECQWVRLREDLPEVELSRGAVGQVVSAWFHPHTAYEVEFRPGRDKAPLRVLLFDRQIVSA